LNTRSILTARTALAVAAAAALGTATIDAQALGLGRLSVQSALGESLKAEIDISSMSAEESSTLSVRVASPEAYRAAGVDYNAVLSNAQVTLLRRPDGRPYLRVTSDRAVQEPFVDVILELNWSTGRLVREFTLLVDPPSRAAPAAQAVAPAPIAPAMAPAPTPAPAPAPAAAPAPTAAAPTTPAATPRPTAAPARPTVANAEGDRYQVRPGDSLSRIANRTQRPGVQLDQMLVGLFRANPDAFMSSNMNRLRAGVVLAVPGADALKAIAPAEAREVIAAHSADFGAYRQKLAQGAPAAVTGEPARQSQGKVQAAVQDRKQTAPAADKLKLSAAPKASAPEAQVAKAAEKKDSATRVAELTRNVEDLKKLQQGATAAQPGTKSTPGASAPGVAVAVPPPVQASAPAPAPSVAAVTAKPVAASAPAPATTKAAATVPSAPVVAAAASPALQPEVKASAAVAASAPRPRPVAAAKPAEEPGLLDSLLSSPLALPGAGLLAIVLAGLGYYKFRGRGGRKEGGETSFLESRVQPDSFFGASGGQRIDTTDGSLTGTSSMGFSLSQLDAIGDVDPVAEADVYLAYGRDLQAEEILKEAMRTTPDRLAIRIKLLEVYAKRRDTKGFELLATQLFAITQGIGADWEKAQEMGRQIDPENALYQPGGRPAEVVRDGQVIAEPLNATTLPQSVMPTASMFPNNEPTLPQPSSLDLDLDLDIDSGAPAPDETTRTMPAAKPGAAAAPTAPPAPAPDLDLGDLSLDLDVPPTIPVPKAAKASDASLDFGDFRLSEPGALSGGSGSVAMGADELPIDESDPIARKIELAEEFRQIGDMEGARDLLEEVIAKSSGALKAKAQHMLGELG
jgi:pilus assembly protein FimV